MNLHLTKEQEAVRSAAREFLETEAKSIVREAEESEEGYSQALWRKMADLGWMGIGLPEEYGGSGGDFLDLVIILEAMGTVLVPGPFIPSAVCASHALRQYGSESQKRELLPKMTGGNLVVTPALADPGSGGRGGRVSIAGDDYVLSGTSLFVQYAHMADWFIYLAGMDGVATLLLVDSGRSGISRSLLETIASDRQFEVAFEDVKVPRSDVLGETGKGEEIASRMNEWGALSQCGYLSGVLERILKMTVEYARKREQFGKPIGGFQAIQHQCADMARYVDEVKLLTYQAAWRLSMQLPATKEISMAKARASDAARKVSLLGTKIHGGIGIILDYDLQLYFRRAKAAEVAFGDGDFHREAVARELGL